MEIPGVSSSPVNTTTLSIGLLALCQVLATSPTLPPAALGPLRAVLSTDESQLDGRLTLSDAMVESASITVTYAPGDSAPPAITVVLAHPSTAPEGVRAGPFVIAKQTGADDPAIAALVKRLSTLSDDDIWRATGAEGDAEGEAAESPRVVAKRSAGERRVAKWLWHADIAIRVDERDRAAIALGKALSDPDLPSDALLDIAEGYQRIKDLEQVKATLKRWKEVTINDVTSPVETARYVALSGGEVAVLKVLQDARVSHNACGFDGLAKSMDAMGKRTEAYLFLDTAARKTECPEVEATLLEWFVEDKMLYEAEQLSGILAQHDSGNPRIAAVRANLLLAMDKAQDALALLQPVIKRNPRSSLLDTYVVARERLLTGPDALQALADESDGDTQDALKAMTVAVIKMRKGQTEVAERYLKRAEGTFAGHRLSHLLRAKLAFDRGDHPAVVSRLEQIDGLGVPDARSGLDARVEMLRAELSRWTDPVAAKQTLRRAVLLGAQQSEGTKRLVKRAKAQISALDACIAAESAPPCPGPFIHPADHPANEDFDDEADEEVGGFGNWLTIFGVLLLVMVMLRQSRMKGQRTSRWK